MNKLLFKKISSLLLTAAMLNLTYGCYNYFKVTSAPEVSSRMIRDLQSYGKNIIIHYNTKRWVLENYDIKNDTLRGTLEQYPSLVTEAPVKLNRPNRYMAKASKDQRYLLNQVHVYLSEYAESGKSLVVIPVKSIDRIDIYDKDEATTVGSWILGGLAVASATVCLIFIIALLTKESCPFIYSWDGANYHFIGEIFSGSIHKPMERDDYLKLPVFTGQEKYQIKITNEVREIQHTNLLELQVFDHPHGIDVLVDKYGEPRTLSHLISPGVAVNLKGEDVTHLISSQDDRLYQSNLYEDQAPLKDGLILEFPAPGMAESFKLAVRAKNSIILDYTMRKLNDLFGLAYHRFQKQQNKATKEELNDLALTQRIPLSVFVERNQTWEFVDFYNVAGPMAFKEDVLSIPLKGDESNPLRVKLEYGNHLWEIDYVAVDYSKDLELNPFTVPVTSATNEKQESITGLINQDDGKYYLQPENTNQAVITFTLPPVSQETRTIILHSKGWYEVLQDPRGIPNLAYLKSFREPDVFNRFTNEQVKKFREVLANIK